MKTLITIILSCLLISAFSQTLEPYVQKDNFYSPDFTEFQGDFYFVAGRNAIWKKDAATGIESKITDLTYETELHIVDNKLIFIADLLSLGRELWTYDGTNLSLLMDFTLGSNSTQFNQLFMHNNELFFVIYRSGSMHELWTTDGTNAGTSLVKTIGLNYSNSLENSAHAELNGLLYFTDRIGNLWESDGTTSGTKIVYTNIAQTNSWVPYHIVAYNGQIYFTSCDISEDCEIYKYDASTGSASLAIDVTSNLSSFPSQYYVFKNKLFFQAKHSGGFQEMHVSDGTNQGTKLLKIINPTGNSNANIMAEFDGNLYFCARNSAGLLDVYRTDGSTAGTEMFFDIPITDPQLWDPLTIASSSTSLIFATISDLGQFQLFISDGDKQNINKIHTSTYEQFFDISNIEIIDNELYVSGRSTTKRGTIWKLSSLIISGIDDEIIDETFTIYPNPSNGTVYFNAEGVKSVEVVDLQGRVIEYSEFENHLDLHDLSSGMYILKFQKADGYIVKSLFLE